MDRDAHRLEVFREVQRGLPRQGPGNAESTLRALALCRGLPPRPEVLDIGCGPGLQTLALARALPGPITAVDLHPEYLEQLERAARAGGVADRVTTVVADMRALPFPDASFDLVWSEGAAYIMGFANAVAEWRQLLRPGGCLAVSELVWLTPDPPAEVADFFGQEYPAMADIETNLAIFEAAGYEVLGHLTLPEAAWWDDYYTPLAAKLPALRKRYRGDPDALAVVESTAREIEMRRRHPDAYGYESFVAANRQVR
jgi:SAM-dependent methyltransferase